MLGTSYFCFLNYLWSIQHNGIRSKCHGQNATDLCVWGFGVGASIFLYWGFGQWHFVIGVLSRDHEMELLYLLLIVHECSCLFTLFLYLSLSFVEH